MNDLPTKVAALEAAVSTITAAIFCQCPHVGPNDRDNWSRCKQCQKQWQPRPAPAPEVPSVRVWSRKEYFPVVNLGDAWWFRKNMAWVQLTGEPKTSPRTECPATSVPQWLRDQAEKSPLPKELAEWLDKHHPVKPARPEITKVGRVHRYKHDGVEYWAGQNWDIGTGGIANWNGIPIGEKINGYSWEELAEKCVRENPQEGDRFTFSGDERRIGIIDGKLKVYAENLNAFQDMLLSDYFTSRYLRLSNFRPAPVPEVPSVRARRPAPPDPAADSQPPVPDGLAKTEAAAGVAPSRPAEALAARERLMAMLTPKDVIRSYVHWCTEFNVPRKWDDRNADHDWHNEINRLIPLALEAPTFRESWEATVKAKRDRYWQLFNGMVANFGQPPAKPAETYVSRYPGVRVAAPKWEGGI